MTHPLTQQDLGLLACPACHQLLLLEPPTIRCTGCARIYPIVDGLPRLIADFRAATL